MSDTLQAINNIDKLTVLESREKWDVLMQAFLSSLDVKEKTRQTYYWAMTQYFEWSEDQQGTAFSQQCRYHSIQE